MSTNWKIKRLLGIFLIAFLVIVLRVWHLGVIQREDKLLEAQKPRQRTVLVRANRGTICDRFHLPLAVNRICYNAAIYYAQISEVPRIQWVTHPDGRQEKIYARKEYIRKLSEKLAATLGLDAERVEDLIHSKAAIFPHAPFVLKSSITEKEHYELRMLEKDWPGISAEITSTRFYPMGKTGCNLIGTMGSISQREYLSIAQEISELKAAAEFIDGADLDRLSELKEKAYAINDLVGKTGIEGQFEEDLRGFFGKKMFEVDQKGRFIREIASKEATSGKKIALTISSELQAFAETLLAQNEKIRDGRSIRFDPESRTRKEQKQPWIKGGAIVALDPNTGEVLAMASHPRFDPNDFIFYGDSIFSLGKTRQVNRWLENERHIAAIWDGHELLKRDGINQLQEEELELSWERYLEFILPKEGPLKTFFQTVNTVAKAVQIQEDYEAMLYFRKSNLPIPTDIQKRIDAIQLEDQDKLFAVDLCRIAVYAPAFTDELLKKFGSMKLDEYRALCKQFLKNETEVKAQEKKRFHRTEFKKWKELNQKEYLAELRQQEVKAKSYAKPYIDYLDKKENELFSTFWEENKWSFLKAEKIPDELMRTFRPFSELTRPLLGKYKALRNSQKQQLEKDLAAAFYPVGGFGYSRSFAFESAVPLGSVFKLVTAYEALRQNHSLTLIDEISPQGVAYSLNRTPYPRFYKGGRLPRSAHAHMGKIDLAAALEQSSNPYFSILAGDYFSDPEDLTRAAKTFGFGEKSGIELPIERVGNLPKDLKTNRTGLYSTAIGQHTLLTTPLQTAGMLACIANGGKLFKPKIVKEAIGMVPDRHPLGPFAAQDYLAKNELEMIGIPFSIFTSAQKQTVSPEQNEPSATIRRILPMDEKIRSKLIDGMARVVSGTKGSARPSIIKGLLNSPFLMRGYLALKDQMVGKTGTAEILSKLSMNPSAKAEVYKYIWFGGISFTDDKKSNPELVVVVFLRFGDAGKEAAPLAAQIVQKWREIKKKHEMNETP